MYALAQLAKNIQELDNGKLFMLTFSNPSLKSLVVSLNKDQLRIGYGANEEPLPDYSEVSVNLYNKPSGRWRLFDTGQTYDSFKVVSVTEEAIVEFADLDIHNVDLQEKVDKQSNAEIIGLGGESLAILQEEAIPIMVEILLNEMLKGTT